ncbi:MAG: hypothetical protein CL489_03430 [Acidobacteria bacterium]|nr:hypothetical protein [Acidobacteriota bacterium]
MKKVYYVYAFQSSKVLDTFHHTYQIKLYHQLPLPLQAGLPLHLVLRVMALYQLQMKTKIFLHHSRLAIILTQYL